jgi:phosphoenolpyruvate carboxykinase (ATP)
MPIRVTRTLLSAALDGSLTGAPMRTDPYFGFEVPSAVPNVEALILNPRETWSDKRAYDAQARRLIDMFVANFAKFENGVGVDVRAAAPSFRVAAE